MAQAQQTERCEDCGVATPGYDTVSLSLSATTTRLLCTRCCNARIAKRAGLPFEHPNFAPLILEDVSGVRHTFHVQTRHGGDHIALDAFELKDGRPGGYQFQVLGEPTQDPSKMFQQLVERLRRALGRRHIEETAHGPEISRSGADWIVRGQIEWDDAEGGELPRLVIDGRSYSWYDVGRMLMTFEGFQVKLEIH